MQDAFLRWLGTDRASVREPEAFLRRVVTRLCLDQLKSARWRREAYVGEWLPEPIVEDAEPDDITLPLMLALERLSPLERAAFLLHDVFGVSFDEVGETIGRDPAAARQLASRARIHVRARDRASRCPASAGWRSRPHSSRHRGAATWPGCAGCWPRMCRSFGSGAESCRRGCIRSMG